MIQTLVSIALLALYIYPSFLVVRKFYQHQNRWEKVVTLVLLSTVITPLYIFYLNHFTHIPLNQKNIFLSLLVLNIIAILLLRSKNRNSQRTQPPPLSKKEQYIYLSASIITILYFGFPYIFNGQPIVGGDTPHYLYNSSLLIYNQFPQLVFDRSVVYFFPSVISIITHLSIETVLKLYVASYELVFILTSLSLAKKYLSTRLLLLFTVALIFSPSTIIISKFIIAFFICFTVLYYIISAISSESVYLHKNLLLPILWGSLFNLHGVVAFSSLIIIPPMILYHSLKSKVNLNKYILWVVLFLFTSQPLILTQWDRINAGIIQPIITSLQPIESDVKTSENKAKAVGAQIWVDEFTTNKSRSMSEFPLNKDSFTSSFFTPTIILAILGIIMAASTKGRRRKTIPIIIVFFILFLLSQQEYFGMKWFPRRFVFVMGPLVYLFSFFYLDNVFVRLKKPLITSLACFFIISLPTTIAGAKKISNLSASINPIEYNFISELKAYTQPGDPIFVGAPNPLWVRTLISDSVVYKSDHQAVCNDKSIKARISKERWEVGQALSMDVTLDESIEIFSRYSQGKPYFVYLDTVTYHCINGKLFPNTQYETIDQKDGYIFLKYKQ